MARTKPEQKRIARQARAGQPKTWRWAPDAPVPSKSQRRAYWNDPTSNRAANHYRPAGSRAKSAIVQAGQDLSRMPANPFRGKFR